MEFFGRPSPRASRRRSGCAIGSSAPGCSQRPRSTGVTGLPEHPVALAGDRLSRILGGRGGGQGRPDGEECNPLRRHLLVSTRSVRVWTNIVLSSRAVDLRHIRPVTPAGDGWQIRPKTGRQRGPRPPTPVAAAAPGDLWSVRARGRAGRACSLHPRLGSRPAAIHPTQGSQTITGARGSGRRWSGCLDVGVEAEKLTPVARRLPPLGRPCGPLAGVQTARRQNTAWSPRLGNGSPRITRA